MIFPVKLEIEFIRLPVSNYVIIFLTTVIFFLMLSGQNQELFELMVLKDWNPVGLFGSIFLHADFYHLLWNMVFLFVFGSAVCSIFGSGLYPIIYLLLGLMASCLHLLLNGNPAVGASGAISGLMGIVLAWFPKQRVKFFYFFWFYLTVFKGSFRLKVIFVVLIYLAIDILGVIWGGNNVAHFAHIGGLAGGILIAMLIQAFGFGPADEDTLLDIVTGKAKIKSRFSGSDMNDDLFKSKNRDAVTDYVSEYSKNKMNDEKETFEHMYEITKASPLFKPLRIICLNSECKCFVVNKGDTITIEQVTTPDNTICEIEPAGEFKCGESGIIKISNISEERKSFLFTIRYNHRIFSESKTYEINAKNNTITELQPHSTNI